MIKGTYVSLPPCVLTITDGCDMTNLSALQRCIFPAAKYRSAAKTFLLLTDWVIPVCWGLY